MNRLTGLAAVGAALLASSVAFAGADKSGTDPALQAAVAGEWRTAEAKARDANRHPVEALTFWGLKPGMTILEVQPGAQSWWTEILAPYAKMTGGKFYATGPDLGNPELPEGAKKARAEFEARYASKPDVYGKVEVVNWGAKSAPLPKDTYDFILTARSVHGWMRAEGMVDKVLKEFYDSLKPGGVLALEQHRANPGPQDPKAESGYVTEQYVIDAAQRAGFKLAAKSEINANPKDTKDHPFGVWTLPPTLRSSAYGSGQPDDPKFDHSKYIAIGESDRMTLRFTK
jgi:predicted methyltransferase